MDDKCMGGNCLWWQTSAKVTIYKVMKVTAREGNCVIVENDLG